MDTILEKCIFFYEIATDTVKIINGEFGIQTNIPLQESIQILLLEGPNDKKAIFYYFKSKQIRFINLTSF